VANIPLVTQKDVDILLNSLQQLYEQIGVTRQTIAPLKENMAFAYREYEKAMGPLRYEAGRLQAEINVLEGKVEGGNQPDTFKPGTGDDEVPPKQEGTFVDPDAIEKDVLLEHLFRVLGEDNDELLSSLTGICNDPTVRLADMLERVPWGTAWMGRGRQETLSNQYHRLVAWEGALSKQLEKLKQTAESLHEHPHFGLWQRYEKGTTVWQAFLARAAEQQKEFNASLKTRLNNLQKKWANMVDNA